MNSKMFKKTFTDLKKAYSKDKRPNGREPLEQEKEENLQSVLSRVKGINKTASDTEGFKNKSLKDVPEWKRAKLISLDRKYAKGRTEKSFKKFKPSPIKNDKSEALKKKFGDRLVLKKDYGKSILKNLLKIV
ncbi:unnamed protein product [Moneuplotes crassus]|uniref:Uncharacterized protein n=1 Tax=Euplotes crassus TaxID=5936 RepID=A0AAD2D0X2_EUPCR|nr:unnamed protein product [Moneuplotes crassus]